jgi:hypothetical protein
MNCNERVGLVHYVTHAELAKKLNLSRATVTRDVAKGMPLDVKGALEWREEFKDIRGEKTGPKTIERDEEQPNRARTPSWVQQEHQEYLLARQIVDSHGDDPKLPVLQQQYEEAAAIVLQNHVNLVDAAIKRRFMVCPGYAPNEAPEKYVSALVELADKWQEVLEATNEEVLDFQEDIGADRKPMYAVGFEALKPNRSEASYPSGPPYGGCHAARGGWSNERVLCPPSEGCLV